jgi:hypothetical protein
VQGVASKVLIWLSNAAYKSRPAKRFSRSAGLPVSSLSLISQSTGENLLILKLLETVTFAIEYNVAQISAGIGREISADICQATFWLPEAILS